jgi:hypothetical protein
MRNFGYAASAAIESVDVRKVASMHHLSRWLSCGFMMPLGLALGGAAAPTVLDRYTGSFAASGTILEGPNASSHQVSCSFMATRQGETGLSLRGTCSVYLIISRSIAVNLKWDPQTGRVTGTYTGSRVGMAQLTGRQMGGDFDLTINWPQPLYGDMTAELKVANVDADRFRIVVMDRIGVNGPVRATTDLTLLRH